MIEDLVKIMSLVKEASNKFNLNELTDGHFSHKMWSKANTHSENWKRVKADTEQFIYLFHVIFNTSQSIILCICN